MTQAAFDSFTEDGINPNVFYSCHVFFYVFNILLLLILNIPSFLTTMQTMSSGRIRKKNL